MNDQGPSQDCIAQAIQNVKIPQREVSETFTGDLVKSLADKNMQFQTALESIRLSLTRITGFEPYDLPPPADRKEPQGMLGELQEATFKYQDLLAMLKQVAEKLNSI